MIICGIDMAPPGSPHYNAIVVARVTRNGCLEILDSATERADRAQAYQEMVDKMVEKWPNITKIYK